MEDDDRIRSMDEYNRTIHELQDFTMALDEFNKGRSSHFYVSFLQTLFFLFVTCLFYIICVKLDVTKELFFMGLFCNSIKDAIYYVKQMSTIRKLDKDYNYFLSKLSPNKLL